MFLMVGYKKYQKINIYQPRGKITRFFIQIKQYPGKKCRSPTDDNTGNAPWETLHTGAQKNEFFNALLNISLDKSEFECTNDDIRGTKFRVRRLRRSVAKPRMSCRCHYGCMPNYYFVF
mgnify:CR=1 FL=1